MKRENNLGSDDIRTLVWRIALPSMLAQFVSVLYSIVDRMYIGHIAGYGDIALAGVGVCGPVVTMVGSFAFWVGVGGAPQMSIRMGEGNLKEAERILSNCFLMLCVLSAVLTVVMSVVAGPMLRVFGASGETLPYAEPYFKTYLLGTIFALLGTGMNQFVISQGFAKAGMKSVLIGAVLNIILDPVFIFVLDLGVQGAAVASVLAQIASCVYVLRILFRKEMPIRISFGGYRLGIMKRVLVLGFTPFIIIALDNVMIIAMNAVLQKYGGPGQGDMLITCATIVQSFMLVITMPLGGITGGTQTILAYNYGAGNTERVLKAQKVIFMLCAGFTAFMFLAARLWGHLFVSLFTKDPELARKAVWAVHICTLAVIPLGIQYEVVDGFTALGCVRYSLPLSFFRKLVYFAALFMIPLFLEPRYIFLIEPISDVLGPAASIITYRLMIRKILEKRRREMKAFVKNA